jgi:hypothetical protein
MEYNQPSELIKELNFGDEAKSKIIAGVDKLAKAVKSTLGASGKCVIYEDARGNPVITKVRQRTTKNRMKKLLTSGNTFQTKRTGGLPNYQMDFSKQSVNMKQKLHGTM